MDLNELIISLSKIDNKLPHGSNLRTKVTKNSDKNINEISSELITMYLDYYKSLDNNIQDPLLWLKSCIHSFEDYYSKIKTDKYRIFSHQSDFLSSLLPEFISILYTKLIINKFPKFVVETQKDLIIDLSFLPNRNPPISFKSKRVDVAILTPCDFSINTHKLPDFNIPLIAVEVKTNLDKNMIAGVEYSVQRLKRTFPFCKYYLISEFADFAFDKQNYASTAIDEIFIMRKQKRSEIRKNTISLKAVDLNLLHNHLNDVVNHLEGIAIEPSKLSERLRKGRLIKP